MTVIYFELTHNSTLISDDVSQYVICVAGPTQNVSQYIKYIAGYIRNISQYIDFLQDVEMK